MTTLLATVEQELDTHRPGTRPHWLDPLRARGRERFEATGLPTPRDEDWKYTSLAPLKSAEAGLVAAAEVPEIPGTARYVMGAGEQAPVAGLSVSSLLRATALDANAPQLEAHLGRIATIDDPFDALNAAVLTDGATIFVAPGTDVEVPLHVVFPASRPFSHSRNLIVAGRNSRVTVVEHFVGPAATYLTNPVTEIEVEAGAQVDYVKIIEDGAQAFHLGSVHARVGRDASLRMFGLSVGGRITRTRVAVALEQGAAIEMTGLYLAGANQLHDYHTIVDHAAPHARSRELFKGILDAGGRGVFTGKILVRPGAQQTDSAQTVRNLLLADDAIANARPQLEIYADDVKCSHGAAVGRLDEEALFYLRSRGLGLGAARKLLTYAFASEVVSAVRHDALRLTIESLVHGWLARLDERSAA